MLMRLAFSIAIQVPFNILLLDEVLAVGDESFQQKCFAMFERFKEKQKTIVLVTHQLELMSRFCDRVLLIEKGVVRATGTPEDVVDLYRETALV
jgi:ABC-type polysaccharide/polyol phosphate transport system ATPase subunit